MGLAIAVTNEKNSAAALRRLMPKQKDGRVACRLLALALILEGHSRTEAARQSGMERQTLRDWVHRYNAEGLAGLAAPGSARPTPRPEEEQIGDLEELGVNGPNPATDRVE